MKSSGYWGSGKGEDIHILFYVFYGFLMAYSKTAAPRPLLKP